MVVILVVSRGRHFVPRAGQPELLMTMLVGVPGKDRWVLVEQSGTESVGKWTRGRYAPDSWTGNR